MKHILRILAAVVFGLAAAGLNYVWMKKEKTYPEYAYVTQDIAKDESFTAKSIDFQAIEGPEEALERILVPKRQWHLWLGRHATRSMKAGEPILQSDMKATTSQTEWDTLGPFRLVGIGDEAVSAISGTPGQLISVSGNTLTLVVQDEQEQEKALLYRYMAAMRGEYYFNESDEQRDALKIIGVEPRVASAETTAKASLITPEASDQKRLDWVAGKRLVFVKLDNIPNTPAWLRIGEEIFFIVPPGKELLAPVLETNADKVDTDS